jgi:hypothetical protein
MSDRGIIHKTKHDSKVVHQTDQTVDTDQTVEWIRFVRGNNIFNDVQARVLADTLIDFENRLRNNYNKEIEVQLKEFSEATVDFVMDKTSSLAREVTVMRERLAMLEGQIKAMTDLKGVPGKQGERGMRGEQGKPGVQGEQGDTGPRGAAGAHWIGAKIVDGFDLIAIMSDGKVGPRISLKQMFAEFTRQQMLTGNSIAAAEPRLIQDHRFTLLTVANNDT